MNVVTIEGKEFVERDSYLNMRKQWLRATQETIIQRARIETLEAEVKEAFWEGYERSGKAHYDFEISAAWVRWRTQVELAAEGEGE